MICDIGPETCFEECQQLYSQALEIDPDDYMTNFYMGVLYYKAKTVNDEHIQKALRYLLKAEQADANTSVLFNLAVLYDEIGDFGNSEKYYL